MKEYIDYQDFGSGKVIILLPSLWLTSKSFTSIAKKLSKKYRVIVPDLYRGKSKYKTNAKTFEDYVDSLNSFIKKLQISNFYLIGVSFSGFIASKYAKKYPSEIMKLFLISTSPTLLNIKRKRAVFIAGYIKLFYHNMFSIKGIKTIFLWLCDGFGYLIKHPIQVIFDALMITRDYEYEISELPPSKLLFAKKDEFISYKEVQKMKKVKNLEVETIDDYHGWFFLDEKLLVEKVFDYFR